MWKTLAVGTITLCIALRCSTQTPSVQCLADPGLDNRLNWEAEHATIAEGIVALQSPTGTDAAQIRQHLQGLKPHTNYTLSAKVRAVNTPSAQLSVDLYRDDGYDSPEQELLVLPEQIDGTFRVFHKSLNTGALPDQPYLRVYTFSTVPIEVEELGLTETK